MSNQVSEWLKMSQRLHDQIGKRADAFLVLNGLFLTATAANKKLPTLLFVVFGLSANVIWLLLSNYSRNRYNFFRKHLYIAEKRLPNKEDRFHTRIHDEFTKKILRFSSTGFFTCVLPCLFILLWLLMLMWLIQPWTHLHVIPSFPWNQWIKAYQ